VGISLVKHQLEVTYAGDIETTLQTGQKLKIDSTGVGGKLLDFMADDNYRALIVVWLEKVEP